MQPKIYSIDEHQIPPEKIDRHAYYVIEKLRQEGFSAYLVGGGVRDLLLNHRPKDFDISTSAKPEEVKRLFRSCFLIGRRFRLAHVRFGQKIIEVATFRAGDNEAEDLIIHDNIWGTAEEDVLRRDFTINGLFYDPQEQTVIDYVGGYPDLKKNLLRTIGNPNLRFQQDPVRMIRLLKFISRFNLNVDPNTEKALKECKEEITKSSPARILEELLRMLESGSSSPFFRLLTTHGLLHFLSPMLAEKLEKEPSIYPFLEEIDNYQKKHGDLERSVLVGALLFPILEKELEKSRSEEPNLHLGEIAEKANSLIDKTFSSFFHIPKRMRGNLISVLTSQFRFVPLESKKAKKVRIPRDKSFSLALKFFELRCQINSDLLPIHTLWNEAFSHAKKTHRDTPRKNPRRRRRR